MLVLRFWWTKIVFWRWLSEILKSFKFWKWNALLGGSRRRCVCKLPASLQVSSSSSSARLRQEPILSGPWGPQINSQNVSSKTFVEISTSRAQIFFWLWKLSSKGTKSERTCLFWFALKASILEFKIQNDCKASLECEVSSRWIFDGVT